MKPNFALSLSFDGIVLARRVGDRWQRVGGVAVDSPDLTAELKRLASSARSAAGAEIRSKLVIPNEQIKYLALDAGTGSDPAELIESALDGATPYAVEDLVVDWARTPSGVAVAAVARETLDEAEAFARDHGFNPVSFVARPDDGAGFVAEVFFGQTRLAPSLLSPGDEVTPDSALFRLSPDAEFSAPGPEPEPEPATEPEPEPEPAADDPDEADAEDATAAPQEAEPSPLPVFRRGGDAPAAAAAPAARSEPPVTAPVIERGGNGASAQSIAAPSAAPNFSSIRANRNAPASAAPRLYGVERQTNGAASPMIPIPAFSQKPPTEVPPIVGRPDPAVAPEGVDAPAAAATGFVSRRGPGNSGAADTPTPKRRLRLGRRNDPAPAPVPPPAQPSERERMTVFGARGEEVVGGKPRFLGLILTLALLLFLAGVAVWAGVRVEDGLSRLFGRDDAVEVALVAPEIVATPAEEEAEDSADAEFEVAMADPDPGTASDSGLGDVLSLPRELPEMTPEEAEARYAATGIWQMSPTPPPLPERIGTDDLYIASIDGRTPTYDAVALPAPRDLLGDLAPLPPGPPPVPGEVFRLDERGLVIATPEGTRSPDGHLVFLGRPPLIPPQRPDTAPTGAQSGAAGAEQVPDTPFADPRLAGIRPKQRPDNLVEDNERSQLSGLSRTELSALRPRSRPALIKIVAEPEPEPETATERAIASVLVPRARPSNLKPIAKPTGTATSEPRAGTEEDDGEPEIASASTASPRIPSSASVAKQATQANAINLSRINLIGVYGKPSARRALVRLSNGRYKKVQVGDSIDGGRVSAIGDAELSYVKGGRSITLKMPKT